MKNIYPYPAFRIADSAEYILARTITGIFLLVQMSLFSFAQTTYNFSNRLDFLNKSRLNTIDIDQLDFAPAATFPLKLENFSGKLINSSCLLSWTTAQEQYSRNFDVEYSTDGNRYNKIGSVAATGNSTQGNRYSFSKSLAVEGDHFYRLKMNDIDDKYVYSPVVIVKKATSLNVLNVYPNPVKNNKLSVRVSAKTKLPRSFQISDPSGRTLQHGVISSRNQKVDLSLLKNGEYFIMLSDGQSQAILVQR